MKYKNLIFTILTGITLIFCGCDNTIDVAPMPTFDGEANMTIADLVALHEIGSVDSYDTIPAGTIISGIVTTSDEWGNCYKYINIEDETGGIQIKINNSALFNKYRVGQRVFVKCDGLHIGDYRKLPQLGIWANGSMQAIPNAKTYLYLFNDGAPVNVEPSITLTSIPTAAQLPKSYINKLVRLENASFAEGGIATFSDPNASTSHDIKMQDGTTITLRTSNYATFASQLLPKGVGNITGILTVYNNTVQLVIRGLGDLENFTTPQVLQTIFSVNYQNAFNEGWSQTSENAWKVLTNSSFNGFYINAADAGNNSWLLSPTIDLSSAENPEISFSHRSPNGFKSENMQFFYTTNLTGDVNTTNWESVNLGIQDGTASMENFNFELPESAKSQNFRIAFRSTDNQSAWYISNIQIKALVSR